MKIKHWVVAIVCLVCAFTAVAQEEPAPLAILQQTSNQMLTALKQSKASLKSDPNAIYRIVNNILLPRVDLEIMGRSVVGRTYWMQATPDQRAEFKRLFTHQVTQTYSAALSSYQNEEVKFFPIRDYTPGMQRVQVQSEIVRNNGQIIPISYRLINEGGAWKVYDISVEGVSIVQSYSAQFSNDLQQGGLAALLVKMRQRYG
jgi:phospholipid transport system substrate-binding protein